MTSIIIRNEQRTLLSLMFLFPLIGALIPNRDALPRIHILPIIPRQGYRNPFLYSNLQGRRIDQHVERLTGLVIISVVGQMLKNTIPCYAVYSARGGDSYEHHLNVHRFS